MTVISQKIKTLDEIEWQIENLLSDLGKGQVDGVAYDTAWVARLAPRYPGYGFEKCIDWLRQHQYEDGTWGAPLVHYHDRFISTLAGIVALREVGDGKRDERRVKRGEQALWHLVGKLNRDDSDTVGFPILSASLAEEALELGLDVPMPPIRYAEPYQKKVKDLLNSPVRNWRRHTVTFSLEALRYAIKDNDDILESNGSVCASPSATAGFLLMKHDDRALTYLKGLVERDKNGSIPALDPIDNFEISWSINQLQSVGSINLNVPGIRSVLDHIWAQWSDEYGIGTSSHFKMPDSDDTAAAYVALKWGGYPVNESVFEHYERGGHFVCYDYETNPAVSAHIRLLGAVKSMNGSAKAEAWQKLIVRVLHDTDDSGAFWWDKWHSSPYYVTTEAILYLMDLDLDLASQRIKWILRTQNNDGGWGYLGESTSEETAYCLRTLLAWDGVDRSIINAAANFLLSRLNTETYIPLWIGKSLYTPTRPIQSAILGVLYKYLKESDQSANDEIERI